MDLISMKKQGNLSTSYNKAKRHSDCAMILTITPPLQGVANFMQPSEIPWKHAVVDNCNPRLLQSLGSLGEARRKIAASTLYRVMTTEFAGILLPCSSSSTTRKVRS